MTKLSDLLQGAIDDGVTVASALKRMEEEGHEVDRGQVYKAVKGQHAKQPTERVLKAWSVGFGISILELRAAAGVPVGEEDPYRPPAFADRLSGDQRTALNELIRTIVEAGTGSGAPAQKIDELARRRAETEKRKREREAVGGLKKVSRKKGDRKRDDSPETDGGDT